MYVIYMELIKLRSRKCVDYVPPGSRSC